MREKLYGLIKPRAEETLYGKVYDICMIVVICLSLVPLMTKEQTMLLIYLDKITVSIFIIDYFLRWITADYIFKQGGVIPFIKYPFSLMAVLDLLSILPSLTLVYKGLKAVRVVRLIKALKVIKIAKSFRYSKNVEIVVGVLRRQKDALIAVSFLQLDIFSYLQYLFFRRNQIPSKRSWMRFTGRQCHLQQLDMVIYA